MARHIHKWGRVVLGGASRDATAHTAVSRRFSVQGSGFRAWGEKKHHASRHRLCLYGHNAGPSNKPKGGLRPRPVLTSQRYDTHSCARRRRAVGYLSHTACGRSMCVCEGES